MDRQHSAATMDRDRRKDTYRHKLKHMVRYCCHVDVDCDKNITITNYYVTFVFQVSGIRDLRFREVWKTESTQGDVRSSCAEKQDHQL